MKRSAPYRSSQTCLILALLCSILVPSALYGQGLLLHQSETGWISLTRRISESHSVPQFQISAIDISATLEHRVANVEVAQTFENKSKTTIEASFLFPLPYDGAIDRLTLLVDGKELTGKLMSAQGARKKYEEIVRRCKDPALLEWVGSGLFQTSLFPIPPGEKRTVSLRYTQVCRQQNHLTEFLFPLRAAKYSARPVDSVSLRLVAKSDVPLKNIYSSTHDVNIDRTTKNVAVITYEAKNVVPTADFRLFIDSQQRDVGVSLLTFRPETDEDGYFLLLATPELANEKTTIGKKNVLFVVDRSGSMSGEKIAQARESLKFVLNNLRENDLFNIVAYDQSVELFHPEMQRWTPSTRNEALGFAAGLNAGGSTNIHLALTTALGMLHDATTPTYVIFLTDGLPTAGETKEAAIAQAVADTNQVRARILTLGVGYDVNARLLDRIARDNYGQSRYVRPNENIEAVVSSLYASINAPVLIDATIEAAHSSRGPSDFRLNRLLPKKQFDLFAGQQAIVVGRYANPVDQPVTINLRGTFQGEEVIVPVEANFAIESEDHSYAFISRLWASRRVGELIDLLDLEGPNEELTRELVRLATKHGILTPYTSFLADETTDIHDTVQVPATAERLVDQLQLTDGKQAVQQRKLKQELRSYAAPATSNPQGLGKNIDEAELDAFHLGFGAGVQVYDLKNDRQRIVTSVRHLGAKTFFRRNGCWIDSSLSREEETMARELERFGPEYFTLVRKYGQRIAPYLAVTEPIVVKIDGSVYRW